MAVKFKERTLHGKLELMPGIALGFEDPRAEDYFIAAGQADETTDNPVHVYPAGSVEIDPDTVFAETGKRVLTED